MAGPAPGGRDHREQHRLRHPVGHLLRVGGAGGPHRSRDGHRALPRLSGAGRHPQGRAGGCRAGHLLAAVGGSAAASRAAGRGTVRPELSGLLLHPRRGRAGSRTHRVRLWQRVEQCAAVVHQRQRRLQGAGCTEHLRRPDRVPGDERCICGCRQRLFRVRRRTDRSGASATGRRRQAARCHRAGRRERPGLL